MGGRSLTRARPPSSFQLLHDSLNRNRFKDKIMQQIKVLQRSLRVRLDARRCNACRPKVCVGFGTTTCIKAMT
ncbi:hypothetical protein GHK62_12885 [Sinorhizobium terangae]|uniref:Uncharacterized protein n=1 Tax=Sinorhizobium terangae TaxID=110322 RepID=A0A6N7LED3_SINTE|nr:hypothetical protein [Sinorhizobium terangae]